MKSLILGLILLLFSTPVWSAFDWHFTCENPSSPGARFGASMVYDLARDEIFLFGRYEQESKFTSADLWRWTSTGWQLATVSDEPSITRRANVSFAFDSTRNVSVLYGGRNPIGDKDETWTWDGTEWTLQTPSTHPPVMWGVPYPMVYDAHRQVCVLARLSETWEWDGSDWSQISTVTHSGATEGSAMVYDSVRQRVVLFAAPYSGTSDSRVLEYDGIDWEMKSPATVVQEHRYPAMFFDISLQKTILFGGYIGDYDVSDDTYSWDGTDWTLLTPAQSPPPGAEYASAYSSAQSVGVITNGYYHQRYTRSWDSNTWLWNGTSWTPFSPDIRPSARFMTAMSWDSDRKRLVLFGGVIGYDAKSQCISQDDTWAFDDDTWEYDGNTWIQFSQSTSPPATECAMAYEPFSETTFLVTRTRPVQTWRWNGSDWSLIATTPIDRDERPLLVYDTAGSRLIMLAFNKTYRWTGSDWQEIINANTPSLSYPCDMAYDQTRHQIVLVYPAGQGNLTTWVFNGTTWSNSGVLLTLFRARVAWEPVSGEVIAIGGGEVTGSGFYDEFWAFDGDSWTMHDTVLHGGPGGREFPAVCNHDSGLYCFGGKDDNGWRSNNELWDLSWLNPVPAVDYLGISLLLAAISITLHRNRRNPDHESNK